MEQIDNRLTTDSKAEFLPTLKIAWPAGRKLQEHVDIERIALLLWHWEHHRTWTTNPGVQTRPESVRFPKHQKHSRTSRTIGIQQPNYTLTFDTSMAYLQLFPTGLHLRSRRGPSSFKAKSFLSFPETSLPVQDATNNEKTRHVQTSAQRCRNMNKPRDHLCGHSLAESLRYGVCQLWWFLQVQGFRERKEWYGKLISYESPFVLFISLHVLSFCSHSCFDWDETFCFTRSSMISWCDVQSQIRYTF